MKPRPADAFLSALILLAGCAGDHNRGVRPGGDEGPHLTVPFFADRRDQWGPAALAGVLTFWGRPISAEDLRREIHFPKQRGSVALDLKYAARARGLAAEMSTGTLEILKRELDAGRPAIVYINTALRWAPIRSYMVVTGYNEYLGGVYAHFGPNKDFFLKYSQFDADWAKTGRWILLVSDKAKPEPKTAVSEPVVEPPPPPVVAEKKRPRPKARVVECVPVEAGAPPAVSCPAPEADAIR